MIQCMTTDASELDTTVAFRLTSSEKAALKAEANALGLTVSAMLYRKVFAHEPLETPQATEEPLFQMAV